ncbi:MAG: twin-arginine translocase TatA/TatE family subunit [Chloroflexota bacterium]
MDLFGIGPLELMFVLVIALIIFGPNDMVKAGKTAGRFLRKIVTSDGWQTFQQTTKEMRTLPNKLIREAGLEEFEDEFKQISPPSLLGKKPLPKKKSIQEGLEAWVSSPELDSSPPPENDTPADEPEKPSTNQEEHN